ncbi:BMP family protein [Rhizobium sp. SG570]|uniref:BMP family protein n=1 Tax=Rhizobium sp. SG570 TaxID=2587113 RepID=UPI001445EDD7|nr:BMP family protein [Rhizobium sp. SG570]NKJ35152.1 basic membrane protein A [Rhizobium sp. SG570]
MISIFKTLREGVQLLAVVMLIAFGGSQAVHAAGLKIAMVMPGPISDNDWNSVGYNGLQAAAKALGAEVAYSENVSDADAERVLRDYASRGYKLIFAHSFSYGDATLNVAEDFPDTTFMAGTAKELAPNVGSYSNPDYQGAYLAGMLGAGASKSKTIGWVGGMPAPNMLANFHAYEAGAKAMVPSVKVLHSFIGSWFDPPKAKEAAIAQVEQGADVLSAQGVGVIDAANARNVFALGAMTDQNHLGPKTVLTSVLWDLGPLITAVGKAVEDKTWTSQNWSFGIPEGAVRLADFHGLDAGVSSDVLTAVKAKFDAIKSGAFTVPLDTSNAD